MFGKETEALSKSEQQAGMMNVVMEKLKKNTEGLPEAAGKASTNMAAFGTTMQNAAGQLGSAFIPAMQEVLAILTPMAQALEETFASEKFHAGVQKFAEGLGQVLEYLFVINPNLLKTVAVLGSMMIVIPKLVAAYHGLVGAIVAAKAAMIALNAVMLANPILLVAAGIALAGVAIVGVMNQINQEGQALVEQQKTLEEQLTTTAYSYSDYTDELVKFWRAQSDVWQSASDLQVVEHLVAEGLIKSQAVFQAARGELDLMNITMSESAIVVRRMADEMKYGADTIYGDFVVPVESGFAKVRAAAEAAAKAADSGVRDGMNRLREQFKNAFTGIAEAIGPSLEQWQSTIVAHQKSVEDLSRDHNESLADAAFEYQKQQIKDRAAYEAERQMLVAQGATEEVAALDEKYGIQKNNAANAYAEQQQMLEVSLAKNAVTQQQAHLDDLMAQDTAMRLKMAKQILEQTEVGAHQDALLAILKKGASDEYSAQLQHVQDMLTLDETLRLGQITGAQEALNALLAAQEGAREGVANALAAAQAAYKAAQDKLLGMMGDTSTQFYAGASAAKAVSTVGTKMKEAATKSFSEVAREIDSGVSAIANAFKNASTVLWTPDVEKGFDNVGEALKAGVKKVYEWLDDPKADIKNKIKKVKEYLEPIQQLFALLATDLSRVVPVTPKGGFSATAELYFAQLAETATRMLGWIGSISEDARKSLPKAAEVAGYLQTILGLLGVALSQVIPAEGAFAERLERYIGQLRGASGRLFAWLNSIDDDARRALPQAAALTSSIRTLFELLNVDLSKVIPAEGAFAGRLDKYLQQLKGTSGRIYDWMMEIPEEIRASVTAAAMIAQDIRAMFELLGVDLESVVPATGAFAQNVDRYLMQLRGVSGRIYDWMMEIPEETRKSVEKAAALSEHVKKLFEILGVDLAKIVPAQGTFAERVDLFLRQLRGVSGRIYNWMMEIPEETRESVGKAAQLAGYVKQLFQLLEVDLTKIIPAEGAFAERLERYLQQLKGASGRVYNWMMEISVEARKNLEEAGTMAGYVKQLFDLLNVDLAKVVPAGPTFSVRLDGYLNGLKEATKKIGDWIKTEIIPAFTEMRDGLATNVLPEVAAAAEDLSSILNLLTFSETFKSIRDNTSTADMGGLIENYMKNLRIAVEKMMTGPDSLPQLKADYGDALAEVKDVAALIAEIIGFFAQIAGDLQSARDSGWIDLGTVSLLMRQLYLTGQILSNGGAPIGYQGEQVPNLSPRTDENGNLLPPAPVEPPAINFSLTLPIVVNVEGLGQRTYIVERTEAVRNGVAILDAIEVG
jgi:cell division inhibitor SulA